MSMKEYGDNPERANEPLAVDMREYIVDSYGGLHPKVDTELGGVWFNPVINTAHDTAATLISAVPAGKNAFIKSIVITNREAYAVRVELYTSTTKIFEILIEAVSSFGLSQDDLVGMYIAAAGDLTFETQTAEVWSAGTTVAVGYYLVDA